MFKLNQGINKLIAISLLFSFVLLSCKKDNNTQQDIKDNNVYVSHTKLLSRPVSLVKQSYENLAMFYPEVDQLLDKIVYDVDVYKVVYNTPYQGDTIEASGLMCIPSSKTQTLTVSITSFQNGTNTSHAEAPTSDYNGVLMAYLEGAASLGQIILIPDYIGFGNSDNVVHPYLHKQSTVKSVENLIIAVKEMINSEIINIKWNENLYLMGYSQGGWSTLCTHKDIADNPETGLSVTASACGAGPYDLEIVQDFMLTEITYPQPVYMAYVMVSYVEQNLIDNPIADFFNEPYASNLPSFFDGQYTNDEINQMLNDTVSVLLTQDFINGRKTDAKYQQLRDAMTDNSVHGWNTSEMIRIYHGTADNYVPPTTSSTIIQEFENAGAGSKVSLTEFPGLDHGTAAFPMILDAIFWFYDLDIGTKSSNKKYIFTDDSKKQFEIK